MKERNKLFVMVYPNRSEKRKKIKKVSRQNKYKNRGDEREIAFGEPARVQCFFYKAEKILNKHFERVLQLPRNERDFFSDNDAEDNKQTYNEPCRNKRICNRQAEYVSDFLGRQRYV